MSFRAVNPSAQTARPPSLSARIHAALVASAKTPKAARTLKETTPTRANVSKSPIKRVNLRDSQEKVKLVREKPKEVTCSFEDLVQRAANSSSPERRGMLSKAGFTKDFLEPEDSASFRDSFVHSNIPPQTHPALSTQELSPANTTRRRQQPEHCKDGLSTSGTTLNSSRVEMEADDRQLIQTLSKELGLEGEYQLIPSECPLPSTIVVRSAQGYQVYDLRRA